MAGQWKHTEKGPVQRQHLPSFRVEQHIAEAEEAREKRDRYAGFDTVDRRLAERDDAAARMQAAQRGRAARKQLNRQQHSPNKAAEQRKRAQLARREAMKRRQSAERRHEHSAATRIQAVQRGKTTRRSSPLKQKQLSKPGFEIRSR